MWEKNFQLKSNSNSPLFIFFHRYYNLYFLVELRDGTVVVTKTQYPKNFPPHKSMEVDDEKQKNEKYKKNSPN